MYHNSLSLSLWHLFHQFMSAGMPLEGMVKPSDFKVLPTVSLSNGSLIVLLMKPRGEA